MTVHIKKYGLEKLLLINVNGGLVSLTNKMQLEVFILNLKFEFRRLE